MNGTSLYHHQQSSTRSNESIDAGSGEGLYPVEGRTTGTLPCNFRHLQKAVNITQEVQHRLLGDAFPENAETSISVEGRLRDPTTAQRQVHRGVITSGDASLVIDMGERY